jgi:hypothetical protein
MHRSQLVSTSGPSAIFAFSSSAACRSFPAGVRSDTLLRQTLVRIHEFAPLATYLVVVATALAGSAAVQRGAAGRHSLGSRIDPETVVRTGVSRGRRAIDELIPDRLILELGFLVRRQLVSSGKLFWPLQWRHCRKAPDPLKVTSI